MVTNTKRASALVIACAGIFLACGGNNPEPATANAPASDNAAAASDAGASAVATPPTSTATATATPPSSGADADAGSAPAPKPPVSLAETKDECTPVGVDFEKRARPKVKECYAQGKKKNPNLEGTVKIKITVDVKGKIKATKIIEKTLPDPVADCMLKAVKATPFPEVEKCWDASLTIPITFPTP